MMPTRKSIIVKCQDIDGVRTDFGSEVKMLMHPQFTEMDHDVSVLWVTLPPGSSTGRHNHPDQDEFEYIVSGQGVLYAGEAEGISVEPFMMVLNPSGLFHNVVNTGSETMYLLRIHVPSLQAGSVHGNLIARCIDTAKNSLKSL
ncbi:MAG: cupin domain-containing protein [Deltaproteobacteria bacterium]|nr:cupin domain-containing protein [Deltaproteobacteria bacterium]